MCFVSASALSPDLSDLRLQPTVTQRGGERAGRRWLTGRLLIETELIQTADIVVVGDGGVEKTITLPWGIGEHTVTLEGMNDAGTRRGAVSTYGEYIRGLIDERINDESVTSRAQAAVGRSEQADSEDSIGVSGGLGVRNETVQAQSGATTEEVYQESVEGPADFGDDLVARRASLDGRIEFHIGEVARLSRQLKGIDAAIEAMKDE